MFSEVKPIWNAKKEIKAHLDFSSVSSIGEADKKYDMYLCSLKCAFEKMRDEKVWSLEDCVYLHRYAMDILAERYYNCLFAFEKRAMCNWKFFFYEKGN